MTNLTDKEEVLIELIHYLSAGRKVRDPVDGHYYHISGMKLKEIKRLLNTPIKKRNGLTALECIDREGRAFLNDLKTYINKNEN